MTGTDTKMTMIWCTFIAMKKINTGKICNPEALWIIDIGETPHREVLTGTTEDLINHKLAAYPSCNRGIPSRFPSCSSPVTTRLTTATPLQGTHLRVSTRGLPLSRVDLHKVRHQGVRREGCWNPPTGEASTRGEGFKFGGKIFDFWREISTL